MIKKILTHWSMAFITLAAITFLGLKEPQVKEILRLKAFDLLLQSETKQVSQDIGVITIDEKAIEKYGQWPWKRDILAEVIYKLREAEVGIIVLPILFSEEDRLGGDAELAEALQYGVVISQVGTTQTNKNAVPRGVAKINDPMPWLYTWPGMLGPIPELGQNASGVGVVNTVPEVDGVVRRMPLIMRVGDETYPAMAIEVIRVAVGAPSYQIKAGEGGIIAMRVPGYPTINTDANARIWLRWNKEYETISLADIDQASKFKGRTVIVTPTAEGLNSIVATPLGEKYMYEITANALQTVLDGKQIKRVDISALVEVVAAVLIGISIILATRFFPYWAIGITLALLYSGTVYASYLVFHRYSLLGDASWAIITLTAVGFHSVFNRFILEFQQKQQIKKQFGTYLSPDMVAQLQKNPDLLKLGGDSRELSIMFTDVRGFTAISEHYGEDVQGLTKIMNRYMTAMTKDILDNKGTIDKYIGDAQMAFWNAPIDDLDHAENAVWTGIKMLDSLKKFNEEVQQEGIPAFGMGLGINTAEVVVGNMGSDQRFDYTCLGDGVNLAARLEGQSKTYGVLIVLGPETASRVKDKINVFELDCIAVKGKKIGVKIYTVAKESEHHRQFLESYYGGDWKEAIKRLDTAVTIHPEMGQYYVNMRDRLQSGKPADWSGTYRATTK
jgi:adenylate cyclase